MGKFVLKFKLQSNKNKKVRKILKRIESLLPMAIVCLAVLWMAKGAHAQSAIGGDWDQYIKGIGVQRFPGTGGEQIATNVILRIISLVKYAMGAVALIFGILYATNLVFARGTEDTITKQKKNFLWAFIGFVILMAADGIAKVFNPANATPGQLINFASAKGQILNIVNYLKWMLGAMMVMLMTVSGIRMIIASGNEEEITAQKRNLVWSGIGMLIVLLASNIVNAFYYVNPNTNQAGAAAPTTAAAEIGGVIRLILVFLGPVAILVTIYAGFLYLFYFDNEERLKQAHIMMIGGVTGIVIIYSAYALVNTFYGGIASITQCQNQCVAESYSTGVCSATLVNGGNDVGACVDSTLSACAQEGKCHCYCSQ
jgi:hypothetical protein